MEIDNPILAPVKAKSFKDEGIQFFKI